MNSTKDQTRYFILMIIAMLFWGVAWTAGKVAAAHSRAEVAVALFLQKCVTSVR